MTPGMATVRLAGMKVGWAVAGERASGGRRRAAQANGGAALTRAMVVNVAT